MSQSAPPNALSAELSAAYRSVMESAATSGLLAKASNPTPHSDHELDRLFGLLRDIRAEAQNLQISLTEIKGATELLDRDTREKEIQAALAEHAKIFEYNRAQIDEKLVALRAFLNANPTYYSQSGDDITFIENQWERSWRHWPQVGQVMNEVLISVSKVDKSLSLLICRCGVVTIPERVDRHLRQLRVGRSLDFHNTFKDELPLETDRREVLEYLYDHPLAIQGVVDVEKGLIYRTSPNMLRRGVSFLIPILLPLLGAWLLPSAYKFYQPGADHALLSGILKGYWVLIAGGYLHVIVGALKEARSSTGKAFLAIEDWVLWLHVKELQIVVGILSLWVGVVGLLVINKTLTVGTAFFVGYSIDSFADLFLERFSSVVTTRTDALKKDLAKT